MRTYDGPPYVYTTTIPPGTRALRAHLESYPSVSRTEVVRSRARCDDTASEHCEARAVDAFTTDPAVRRAIFDDMVRNADALGVQSVIADRRVWGFGRWQERHYAGPHPHDDHVHVGLNRAGAKSLTVDTLRRLARPPDDRRDTMHGPETTVDTMVWDHPLINLVADPPRVDPARLLLQWAHLDANAALMVARDCLGELQALRREIAALREALS